MWTGRGLVQSGQAPGPVEGKREERRERESTRQRVHNHPFGLGENSAFSASVSPSLQPAPEQILGLIVCFCCCCCFILSFHVLWSVLKVENGERADPSLLCFPRNSTECFRGQAAPALFISNSWNHRAA